MTPKKSLLLESLHVFVLSSFALAQPLFDRLGRKSVYLEDQAIERPAILLWVLILSVVIPTFFVLVEFVAGLFGQRTRDRVHAVVIFILSAAIALPILRLIKFLDGMTIVALGIVIATLCLIAYRRSAHARMLVTAATPALLVFPGLFLFHSPVTQLLFLGPKSEPKRLSVQCPVPVVFVVFDEFCGTSLMNQDHLIDGQRYPNFAALAEIATWFRNATSVHQRTENAVPAILTGNYPRPRRTATLAHHPQNLFTLLKSTEHYELTVFEPFSRLFPPDVRQIEPRTVSQQMACLSATLPWVYLHQLLPPDLPFELPDIPREWYGIREQEPEIEQRTGVFRHYWNSGRAEQFDSFLEHIAATDGPELFFEHLVVPHFPWCYLPSGGKYLVDKDIGWQPRGTSGENYETWGSDELAVAHAYQRYLLQVGFADHLIGRLLDRLKELDLFDRSLIIVTADHGVSFRPGQSRRAPTAKSLPDILSVPLFVKAPGQHAGTISDRNAETIDILPTIVDALGLELPSPIDGNSLLDPSQPERMQKIFFGDSGRITQDPQFDSKYETVARMIGIFGSGVEPGSLFKIGPHPELIGQTVMRLDVVDRPGLEIKITQPKNWTPEDSGPIVPCYFEGRVLGEAKLKLPVELAIAVNGTIRAVTRTYLAKEIQTVWSAMLPESSLQDGRNEVQWFVISSAEGKLQLAPARGKPFLVTLPARP